MKYSKEKIQAVLDTHDMTVLKVVNGRFTAQDKNGRYVLGLGDSEEFSLYNKDFEPFEIEEVFDDMDQDEFFFARSGEFVAYLREITLDTGERGWSNSMKDVARLTMEELI